MFDKTYSVDAVRDGVQSGNDLPKGCWNDVSEGMAESNITGCRFSKLEAISRKRANLRASGHNGASSSNGMVRLLSVEFFWGQKEAVLNRGSYHSSQSEKSLLEDFLEHKKPTFLDRSLQTTNSSANRVNQFAHAVELQLLLTSSTC